MSLAGTLVNLITIALPSQVLCDSDILVYVFAQRQPFVVASAQALHSAIQEWVEVYVSGYAIAIRI